MSAFDRHPDRKLFEKMADDMAYFNIAGRLVTFSPQNRRVRFNACHRRALSKTFPNTLTRQQRRYQARKVKA